jgi:hemerythrin
MKLEWTPALSVGIEDIDAQHRELFARAARLLDRLHEGLPEEVGPLIDFLHQYAVLHFSAEEAQMRAVRYPGYLRHKAQHDRFIADLTALARERERRGPRAFLAVKASHWIGQWLKEHVSVVDGELGRFLARRSA